MSVDKRDPLITLTEYEAAHAVFCKVFIEEGVKAWIAKCGNNPTTVHLDRATERVMDDYWRAMVHWTGMDLPDDFRAFLKLNGGHAFGMVVHLNAPELSFEP